jgi:CTP:molybdopterin cytidylyltransferase MocA
VGLTAAIVLAGGAATRFDAPTHKLLVEVRGKPLVRWAIDAALEAGLDQTILVVGPARGVYELVPAGVHTVYNAHAADGIATSLCAGIGMADRLGCDAVVVGLADQPDVRAASWRALATADATPLAVATYGGERGHPVRIARDAWSLLPSTGDVGARVVMASRPELVTEVPCTGSPVDIDTVEDLQRWS